MKFIAALMLVITLPGFLLASPLDEASKWNGEKIEWLSFDKGTEVAKRSGRPIFTVFHATWCPQCRRYRKQFYDETVVQLSKRLVMVLVDSDAERKIDERYAETGNYVPRTAALTSEAELLKDITGRNTQYPHFLDSRYPDDIIKFMQTMLK